MDDEWIAQIKYNETSGADGGSHTILVHSVVGSGT